MEKRSASVRGMMIYSWFTVFVPTVVGCLCSAFAIRTIRFGTSDYGRVFWQAAGLAVCLSVFVNTLPSVFRAMREGKSVTPHLIVLLVAVLAVLCIKFYFIIVPW